MDQDKTIESKYQRDGVERMVRLYEAWAKSDQHCEWRRKLEALDQPAPP